MLQLSVIILIFYVVVVVVVDEIGCMQCDQSHCHEIQGTAKFHVLVCIRNNVNEWLALAMLNIILNIILLIIDVDEVGCNKINHIAI